MMMHMPGHQQSFILLLYRWMTAAAILILALLPSPGVNCVLHRAVRQILPISPILTWRLTKHLMMYIRNVQYTNYVQVFYRQNRRSSSTMYSLCCGSSWTQS